MFIASDLRLEPASALSLRLTLPGGRSTIVSARVVHSLPADQASRFGLPAGVGVQFDKLDPLAKTFVAELVDWAVANGPGPRIVRIRPGADSSGVRGEPLLGFLLGYVDGRRDLDALSQELALEPDTIERMLGQLSRQGIVEIVPPPASLGPTQPPVTRASVAAAASKPAASQPPHALHRSSVRAPHPSRAALADVAAAAEAARVAAASSARPSQAPSATPSNRTQPPPATLRPSGRPPGSPAAPSRAPSWQPTAASRPPSARPVRDSKAPQLGAAAQILAQAELAFAAGRTLEASRHMKLLAAMTFDDALTAQRAAELRKQVLRGAAVELEKQAIHEEGHKRWDKAADCWLRVAEGRPQDSLPLQRAALAQLQAGGELRVAVETAKRAVQLAPNDAQAHRLLARVYTAADMQASASRALDAARRCSASNDPAEDATPTALLKRLLGRGEPE